MSDSRIARADERSEVRPALSVTLLRSRRHVDLCRTATALCRS